jgi:Ni,Fe-hydrogenase I cytochrome b subunit
MRVSKRVTYNKDVPHKSIEGQDEDLWMIEEFPGEVELSWWIREIPPMLLLIAVGYYMGNAFGFAYLIILASLLVPLLFWSGITWLLDHRYH